MDGIHIPQDIAEAVEVPEDLDSAAAGEYRFPDPRRRRIAAVIYAILGIGLAVVIPDAPGRWIALAGALALAGWQWLAAWPLRVRPDEALAVAAAGAPFPIGHASAAIIFHGLRARPRWHVILYDAASPPRRRALIVVDGVSGTPVGDPYLEDVPASAL
jgi:hypothetical protein